jgi:NADH:ubiquinone oxidoreductase subunit H
MSLGWKVLLPLATLNVLITAVVIVLDDEKWWIW